MADFTFQKATVHQARLRLGLVGPAGSGKTLTALKVSAHLGGKVAVIDTERGSASKYASEFDFDVLELRTFSPNTYVEAIHAAEAAGYDVLIIDSLSHAWMGKDGALEMVDRAAKRSQSGNNFGAWRDVTPQHNAMVDAILSSTCHVIATMRAKTEYVQERDERTGKTVVRKIGLAPVQRQDMDFEFDVCGDLDHEHNLVVTKSRCSALADAVIPKPGKELAEQLRAWLGQGEPAVMKAEPVAPPNGHAPQATPPSADTASQVAPSIPRRDCGCPINEMHSCGRPNPNQDYDEPPSAHTDATLAADLDAAFTAQAPKLVDRYAGSKGAQQFKADCQNNLNLDLDQVQAVLGGTVAAYMRERGKTLGEVYTILVNKALDNEPVPGRLEAKAASAVEVSP